MASVKVIPASGGRTRTVSAFFAHRALPWRGLIVFAFFCSITVAFQIASGCYRSEFDGYPDEPAHYITGLMVHDYIASGSPIHPFGQASPLRFAENYYVHYPKVSFGHWPPLFYVLQAAWTLLFSISRTSVLVLMALTTAAVAQAMFLAARERLGILLPAGLGFLWILTPFVQANTGMVMAESLVAFTALLAAMALGRYLDREAPRDALWFGVWTLCCILTKGDGWALALAPPLGIALCRKWHLLRKGALYGAAAIVALAIPWQLMTLTMVEEGWEDRPGFLYSWNALRTFFALLAGGVGWVAFGFALLGAAALCLIPLSAGRSVEGFWAAMFATAVGGLLLHAAIPAGIESRRLIPVLPEVLLLTGGGIAWLGGRMANRWAPYALAGATGVGFFFQSFSIPPKTSDGFAEAAEKVLRLQPNPGGVVFVTGTTSGEGSFIAELAMGERRPGHYVLRGTKMLVRTGWAGHEQTPIFQTPSQVAGMLDDWGVNAIAVEMGGGGKSLGRDILLAALAEAPAKWVEAPLSKSAGGKVELLVRKGPELAPKRNFQIDLTPTLGRTLSE